MNELESLGLTKQRHAVLQVDKFGLRVLDVGEQHARLERGA